MHRLSSLDYLRGLAAFGVMVFHYTAFSYGWFLAQDFLGRVGIYAVSIFYVLSGLTLCHVYFSRIGAPSLPGLTDFAIKRLFRIFPLVWLVITVDLIFNKTHYTVADIFLNYSGFFSFYHWDDTIAYGAWSIGNELIFYLFFPVFVLLAKSSKFAFFAISLLLVAIFSWFAFHGVDASKSLADNWTRYTHPLNQVSLFLAGFLVALYSGRLKLKLAHILVLIVACMLCFWLIPANGDSIVLVSGANRFIFSLLCIVLCAAFYKTDFRLPAFIHTIFGTLGEISYSVYLIHPVAWNLTNLVLKHSGLTIPVVPRLLLGIVIGLALAYFIYQFYERYFMQVGKKLSRYATTRMTKQPIST